jgi:hypothetical protein
MEVQLAQSVKKSPKNINLLDFRPRQLRAWEMGKDGGVQVLVPKFHHPFLAKWLMPRLRSPYIRVKLDALGSFVWKQCDGKTTVAEIADRMREEFGGSLGSVEERVGRFLTVLRKSDLVKLDNDDVEVMHV